MALMWAHAPHAVVDCLEKSVERQNRKNPNPIPIQSQRTGIAPPLIKGVGAVPAPKSTSIKQRLNTLTGRPTIDFKKAATDQYNQGFLQVADLNQKPLLGFKSNTKEQAYHLPCSQMAYIELVDWTGRAIREDKAGFIDANLPNILSRLDIDTEDWIANATRFESSYQRRFGKQISKVEKTANIG